MAQLAFSVGGGLVGGIAGGFVGMPGIGFSIGSMVGGFLYRPKPSSATEFIPTASTYGTSRPIVYGTDRVPGNMIWCGPIQTPKTNFLGKGGLGGTTSVPKADQNTVSFALGFCEGVAWVLRLWADGTLVYDATNEAGLIEGNSIGSFDFTWYPGGETQLPDPLISEWVAANVPDAPFATPAYRGLAYGVFQDFPIWKFGYRIPNLTAEVATTLAPNLPATALAQISGTLTAETGGEAVDWINNIYYVGDSSNGGVRAYSIGSTSEVQQIIVSGFDGPLAVKQGGSDLYVGTGYVGSVMKRIDANTGTVLATYGGAFPFYNPGMVVQTAGNKPFVVITSEFANYGVIDGITMDYIYGDNTAADYVTITDINLFTTDTILTIPGPADPLGSFGIVYLIANTAGAWNLWQMQIDGNAEYDSLSGISVGISVTQLGVIDPAFFGQGWASMSITSTIYDQTTGNLILSAHGSTTYPQYTIGLDPSSCSVVWQAQGEGGGAATYQLSTTYSMITGNRVGLLDQSNQFVLVDTSNGAIVQSGTITSPGTWGQGGGQVYNGATQNLILSNSGVTNTSMSVRLGLMSGALYNLSDIIKDQCARSGLADAQIDTTQITTTLIGYSQMHNAAARDVLTQLSGAYFFDGVESDLKIKFVPRGTSPVKTIVQDDLASAFSAQDGNYFKQTRSDLVELPVNIQINFRDMSNDHLPNAAAAKRQNAPVPTIYSKQKQILDLPITMNLPDATIMAQTWLATIWQESRKYESAFGWQYIALDPSDAVTIDLNNGNSYTVRISTIEMGADMMLKPTLTGQDLQTYSQTTSLPVITSPYVGRLASNGFARLFLLNVPLLVDNNDTGGVSSRIYYGAGALDTSWSGGTLYFSADGENYSIYDTLTHTTRWGTALNALPAPPSLFATDNTNTLKISLGSGTFVIESVTYTQMLNGANAALLGNEIIQFENVVANADGTYSLTGLLRGRRGTEWACGTHTVGETLIILDNTLYENTIALSQINSTGYWKLVPFGQYPDSVQPISFVFLGYDLKPYAPDTFSWANSSGNMIVSWLRRSRIDAGLQEGVGTIPLAEQSELYNAYVLTTPYDPVANNWKAPTVYVRSFLGLTSPTFNYTLADLATDGITIGTSTVYVVVFQVSAAIGNGWPGAATLLPDGTVED
jgi:Putative phage tail protein